MKKLAYIHFGFVIFVMVSVLHDVEARFLGMEQLSTPCSSSYISPAKLSYFKDSNKSDTFCFVSIFGMHLAL